MHLIGFQFVRLDDELNFEGFWTTRRLHRSRDFLDFSDFSDHRELDYLKHFEDAEEYFRGGGKYRRLGMRLADDLI